MASTVKNVKSFFGCYTNRHPELRFKSMFVIAEASFESRGGQQ